MVPVAVADFLFNDEKAMIRFAGRIDPARVAEADGQCAF